MKQIGPARIDARPPSLDPRNHEAMARYRGIPSFPMHIGGLQKTAKNNQWIEVIDPATEQTIARVPSADAGDVDEAIKAATRAGSIGLPWQQTKGPQREAILLRLAEHMTQHRDELVHLLVLENGKLQSAARREVESSIRYIRYAAGWATKIVGETIDTGIHEPGRGTMAYTLRVPIGVVAGIIPWNMPLSMAIWKTIPALACGCTVVLLPAAETPLSSLRFCELTQEAGLPPGVFNVITGHGPTAGAALAKHPGVNRLSFTGSTEVGPLVGEAAIRNLAAVSLELGGKSPNLVFQDADLPRAITNICQGIFYNQGQICAAGSRLYVQRKIFDAVMNGIQAHSRSMQLGSGLDPRADLGPLISAKQKQRVLQFVDRAQKSGARIITGGKPVDGPGYFVEPTILTDVHQSMEIVQEEVFGPVLVAMPFDTVDEAIELANDSAYGLSANLYTQNLDLAHAIIPRLCAGSIYVNSAARTDPALPFGGFRGSGIGREHGRAMIEAHTLSKSVVISYQT